MRRIGKRILVLTLILVTPTLVTAEISSLMLSQDVRGESDRVAALEPWLGKSLPPRMRSSMTTAFDFAVARLRDRSECRRLFENLGADGLEVLAKSLYYGVSLSREQRICRRTSAYTQVGGRVTRLCRSFSRLREHPAAVVLIHEALHQAGMSEKPLDPQALDSAQINQLVSDRCGL